MNMILPNLIIAGAPKCGTTSLFGYLKSHPNVCDSSQKETRYLIDRGYPLFNNEQNYLHKGLKGYNDYFKHYDNRVHKITLDATPDYLYQDTPLTVLPKLDPPPKIIIILRKPSERIYSLFKFAQNNMAVIDKKISFDHYIKMIETNNNYLEHKTILKNAIEHSKYIIFIKKWYQALGVKNINIFLFEEMISNPLLFMERISEIIDIDKRFYYDYEFLTKNGTYKVKSNLIHRMKRKYSGKLPGGESKRVLKNIYEWINISKSFADKTDTHKKMIEKLDEIFITYNNELISTTGVNLDIWDRKS